VLKKFRTKPIPENRMKIYADKIFSVNSCLDFITKEMWPLNSPEWIPLDHHVWRNVRGLSQAPSKTEDIAELKEMLQMIV